MTKLLRGLADSSSLLLKYHHFTNYDPSRGSE
jgi:hypothetical protein